MKLCSVLFGWRPKKPKPGCNAPDMPTSARSGMAREHVEPPRTGKNQMTTPKPFGVGASRSCRPTERSAYGHRSVLSSCPNGVRWIVRCIVFYRAAGGPARAHPLSGKSRVRGNSHARFLGGRGRVNRPCLPGAFLAASCEPTFMWPFNRTPKKPPADPYSDYLTPEQFLRGSRCAQLTSDERAIVERRLSAFDGQMVHPQYAADMFGVFAAAGLATYGLDIVRS